MLSLFRDSWLATGFATAGGRCEKPENAAFSTDQGGEPRARQTCPSMVERATVRILTATALCISLSASCLAPVPVDATGEPDLPAAAFEQVDLYRLEVALIAFYGALLLATPTFSGIVLSRLPIEIVQHMPDEAERLLRAQEERKRRQAERGRGRERRRRALIEDFF